VRLVADFVSLNPGSISSNRPIPSIRHDDRSGDIGRKVGGQENRRADDVFRLTGAAERRVVEKYLYQLRIVGAQGCVERRLDQAGTDGVDAHAVLAELNTLRASGLTIGMSVSGPRQGEVIRRALAVRVDGINPFQSVQATWNLLEPSAGPALAEAHDAGWGVISKEALSNGRLADRDQDAIAAALAYPWADVVLSGAVTAAQLRSNLGALGLRLSPDQLAELSNVAEPTDHYWKVRGRLSWS